MASMLATDAAARTNGAMLKYKELLKESKTTQAQNEKKEERIGLLRLW